ncbi:MAG: histidine kinase dimerization/phosphoacceptor domain -containing protein [Steroidobacter sp.]
MMTETPAPSAVHQFGLVLDAAPIGMLVVDANGTITFANAHVEDLLGYRRNELVGAPLEQLVPAQARHAHPQFRQRFLNSPSARAMGGGRDLFALRKDGLEIPVEIGLSPLLTQQGTFVLSSIVDITERKVAVQRLKEQSAELAATLKEREVLLQEIHHRVKNNLQIIASMINMQLRTVEAPGARNVLSECKTRVDAIALIHEKLYQSRDFSNIPFEDYARGLIATIQQASGSYGHIATRVEIQNILLPVAQAIPCGLIVNELVTNSIKHAFPERGDGTITVSLLHDGPSLTLRVRDDGVGMSDAELAAEHDSIGLQLVASLADQLDGTWRLESDRGLVATVNFPALAE